MSIFLFSPILTGWFWCSISQSGGPLISGWVGLSRSGLTKCKTRPVYGLGESILIVESLPWKAPSLICWTRIRKHSAWCPWWPLHSHQGSHGMQRKAERQGSLHHTTIEVYQPSICEPTNSPLMAPVKLIRHFLYLLSSGSSERVHVQCSPWHFVLIDASYEDRAGRAGE